MKRTVKKGFTLVEILIVVIILGILAAIVIPQFTQASQEARLSNLRTNLQTVRSQLLLYKTQHNEKYPETDFADQMCHYSNISGGTSATPDPANYQYGPYLQAVPINPFSNLNTIRMVTGGTSAFSAPDADGGWWFNCTTGEFRADLVTSDDFKTPDGTSYNAL